MIQMAVVDYGAGNLVSIGQALEAVGASVRFASSDAGLVGVDALIVPGVGAAAPAMDRLRAQGLVDPIRDWIRDGRPYLGICLGLQLLFDGSDEDGAETLGIVPGQTVLLEDAPTLPHIGWNQVVQRHGHPLFNGIPDGADFYFVHSYAGRPAGPGAAALTLAETVHGTPFVSALASGPLLGVQFHPERSGPDGLRLLSNFVRIASHATARTVPAWIAAGGSA
jgi:imidazole glycerol phosphate synthase glutamine amidotransferase subunit